MRGRLVSLADVGLGLVGILAVLALPSLATAQLGELPIPEPVVPVTADDAVPPKDAPDLHRVRLAVDGFIPGSVKTLDKLGALMPARATISVFQNGLLLTTTQSNEQGRFQLPGLRPGVYSVIADAGRHMGVFAVEVLPFRDPKLLVAPVAFTAATGEGTQGGEMALDLVLSTEVDDEPPMEQIIEDYGYSAMSGGGGGGHGGGGMLLGLAGLAGLAGLGGLGGGGAASPATP